METPDWSMRGPECTRWLKGMTFFEFCFVVCTDSCHSDQHNHFAVEENQHRSLMFFSVQNQNDFQASFSTWHALLIILHTVQSGSPQNAAETNTKALWMTDNLPQGALFNALFFLIQDPTCSLCHHLSSLVEHFTCVVKMLYNLQFIQAVSALSTKFSPEERQAWSTSGALKKVGGKSIDTTLRHYSPSHANFSFFNFSFVCSAMLRALSAINRVRASSLLKIF